MQINVVSKKENSFLSSKHVHLVRYSDKYRIYIGQFAIFEKVELPHERNLDALHSVNVKVISTYKSERSKPRALEVNNIDVIQIHVGQ